MQDNLLVPSLSNKRHNVGLYSVRSSFLVAFFGGPIAQILYSTLNSYRLKRPQDSLFYLGAIVLSCLLFYFQIEGGLAVLTPLVDGLLDENHITRNLPRLLALLIWGGAYLLHRNFHRSAQLFNMPAPNPWIPALLCMGVGYLLSTVIFSALAKAL